MTSLDHEKLKQTFAPTSTTIPIQNRSMGRRNLLAGLGALGIAGGLGVTRVLAQEATPTPSTADDGVDVGAAGETETDETLTTDEIGAKYQDFLAKLAGNLGLADPTEVDLAIRDSLKAMVDDAFNAGEISANLQTELKERIDTSVVPIRIGMGNGGGGFMDRRDERQERREERREKREDAVGGDESDDSDESDEDTDSATPSI